MSGEDIGVRLVREDVAVLTAITTGSVRTPDGNDEQGPWRFMGVYVKEGEVWRAAAVDCSTAQI